MTWMPHQTGYGLVPVPVSTGHVFSDRPWCTPNTHSALQCLLPSVCFNPLMLTAQLWQGNADRCLTRRSLWWVSFQAVHRGPRRERASMPSSSVYYVPEYNRSAVGSSLHTAPQSSKFCTALTYDLRIVGVRQHGDTLSVLAAICTCLQCQGHPLFFFIATTDLTAQPNGRQFAHVPSTKGRTDRRPTFFEIDARSFTVWGCLG